MNTCERYLLSDIQFIIFVYMHESIETAGKQFNI